MERKDYQDCINSLLDAVQTLLDANNAIGELAMRKRDKKVERVQAPPLWLTFIETCKLQKKAALDFFNVFFRMVTEGRCDYELIA